MAVLTLAVAMLLTGVLPTYAATGADNPQPSLLLKPDEGQGNRWQFGEVVIVRGEVTDVEVTGVGSGEIEVDEETVIMVDEATKIRVPTLGSSATLDDIELGMKVAIQAYEIDDKLHARHIVVIPGKPQYRHHVGIVTEYEEGVSITIEDKWENTVTFEIADEFKVLPPGATVEEGKRVTVISRRDPAGDCLIARGVVVHSETPLLNRLRLMIGLRLADLSRVTGIISVNESENLITVDDTELTYDDSTLFILRGVTSADEQEGAVFYQDELARLVLVRVDTSEIEED